MAEAKTGDVPEILSMSLDDIINKNKTKTTSGRKEINGERKGRIGKPSGRREAGGGRGLGGAPGLRVVVQNAGVQKGAGMRSAGGAGGKRSTRGERIPADPEVLEGSAKWQHDLFDDFEELPRRNLQQRLRGPADGFRLMVSNLADGVSDEDIKELFESCGRVKYAGINWDRSGRSTGTAEVVYEAKADALKAKSQFDKVALDGQPMAIELHQPGATGERTLSSGIRVGVSRAGSGGAGAAGGSRGNVAFARAVVSATGGAPAGGSRRGRAAAVPVRRNTARAAGGRGGGGGGGGGRRAAVSQADLDKDLEAYMEE